MSNPPVAISELPEADALTSSDEFAVVQGGATKRAQVPPSGLLAETALGAAATHIDLAIPSDVFRFAVYATIPPDDPGVRPRLRLNADDGSNYSWRLDVKYGSNSSVTFTSAASTSIALDRSAADQLDRHVLVSGDFLQDEDTLRCLFDCRMASITEANVWSAGAWLNGSGVKVTTVRLLNGAAGTDDLPSGTRFTAVRL